MKKMTYLALGLMMISFVATSCKKNDDDETPTAQKGQVVFKMDGKNYSSTYSATASYVASGVLTVSSQGKVGSDIYPTQIMITFEEAAVGTAGTSENMTIGGSKATDTWATHWDSNLVGSASGAIETLNDTECKGTFAATVKTESGSKTFEITEGEFWLEF